MSILVKQGGLRTTIQDLGRYSFQKYGVVVGGAMDSFSHKLANLLVGNQISEATLEITLLGPELVFLEDTIFAICGGYFLPQLNFDVVPMGRPIFVKKGSILKFGNCQSGCRAYLAIKGGIDTPLVMMSRSTYEPAKYGGLHGEKLKKGDIIPVKSQKLKNNFIVHNDNFSTTRWFVHSLKKSKKIRVTRGRQYSDFTLEAIENFFEKEYQLSLDSDRMGYRLEGEKLVTLNTVEQISEATAFGTVQVPADGQPIILMADRQPTGGYPKLANVISVDLPLLAQLKPRDMVQFEEISLEEAQELYVAQEKELRRLSILLKQIRR
ncbi:biotin-dependent carboxyltransferase [Anaerobacillus sp. CMMVII]|uniref:5-oxoprolinase subunit C family protein n=1 Tax=Anaerobacillus sp. CMMVII TaxID=2755588 RepID=UPI0021B73980|nr:biotin-dependent carboxyltransferase family protein [Anaerobacillus sp. CMMVII]MCT8138163.1 biotin-dependent carboxyltransferase [Anaerobacillus sp. CMMVII]